MKALYLSDNLELKELEAPQFHEGQALVKLCMAGICNTDLELVKGYMSFEGVLGHEFVGVVEKADDSGWMGKRICGEINFGCGECNYCEGGLSRHCPNRTVLGILDQNGVFAEYTVLPIENLHAVPDSLPDGFAVFVEPLAAALEILEQIKIEPNHKVAVIGDGKLGLLICQVLKLTGCEITLIGKHSRKLSLAKSWSVNAVLLDERPEEKFDAVVEVSGSSSGFDTAMELIKPRGTIILKSTYHGKLGLNAAPIVINEVNIVGSRCGPFTAAIRVLDQKLVDVESLIDTVYPFDQSLKAIEHAKQSNSLKILLDFNV
ncbi:alcohol dehydrogenase catalytic domain-containing protein [candidate division KSB1 bacterium]|nr:alcohol dehydrogenase catalytic domain-containing protein [candidate division KSB1 bacterium]NIR72837.1 alcohol dehydrogenase catalytic domain-containing protein [candidate division KSB1 bacterium]NIS26877.1 alcohol dehydrogenase catalytic domain-containing protein [candidate division KSB1 bacterium]NIT73673.1 alcohol dehydrogenase catalytic domain-containing protein [candidate division KSB1 bacterium]NIU27544.1 alcohol dehydrogenase catalytic domain-containing protein [candidate division KS